MRICIDSELNSLMRDMWVEQGPNILEENLKNLEVVFMKRYPISKRRQMLLEAEQEAGEVTSVYWRRIRRMRYEAEIDQMTPDMWDTMLALAKTKDEAIKEKLIVIPNLTFDAAMATIETIEKARVTQGMEPTTVRKVEVQVNRVAQAKPASANCLLQMWSKWSTIRANVRWHHRSVQSAAETMYWQHTRTSLPRRARGKQ